VVSVLAIYFQLWIFILVAIIGGLASGVAISLIALSPLINFNPNAGVAARRNQQFSERYPVLKRSDFENLWRGTQI
jgi:hypothetical protein